MADNIPVTSGSGNTVAAEEIATIKYQKVKLVDATAGSASSTGVAANPLQVSLANHGANATAVKVDGSAVTQPVSGTVSITSNSAVNVAQINGVTPLMGSGVMGTGSHRVTIASNNDALAVTLASVPSHAVTNAGTFAVQATLAAETTKVIGTVNQGTNPWVVTGGGGGTEYTEDVAAATDPVGTSLILVLTVP